MTLGIAYRLVESRLESLYYLKKKNFYNSFKSKRAQSITLAPPRAIVGHLSLCLCKAAMTHGGVSRFIHIKDPPWALK